MIRFRGGTDEAHPWRARRSLAVLAAATAATLVVAGCTGNGGGGGPIGRGASWTMWGHDYDNSHAQPNERSITAQTVGRLKTKWVTDLKGDISATPTVENGVVYVPDWGGYLTAMDANTGAIKWQKKVGDYVGFASYFSRTAPTIDGDWLIIGLNTHHTHAGLLGSGDKPPPDDEHGDHEHGGGGEENLFQGAWMASVNKNTGALRWAKQIEKRKYAAITGSPVVRNGRVVVGVSSNEWDFTGEAGFPCCTSRGSVVSMDARTGNTLWQTYTIPDTHECTQPQTETGAASGCSYSGGSVASTPAIDPARNTIFVGTGQNYTVPDSVRQCVVNARAAKTAETTCLDPNNHFDSLIALDFTTGRIKWAKNVLPYDPWNAACVTTPGVGNCPEPYGPDADLISSPNLFTTGSGLRRQDVVGSGQKSGIYWAFDRDTGRELWHTNVGPGSTLGGIEWGTAVDDQRVYAPISNPFGQPYNAPDGHPITRGSWAALDKATGRIMWQTQVPGTALNAALGSPAVTNGVMFASSIAPTGDSFFALDGLNGRVLWSFPSGGSNVSSPAIANGVLYWGSGYSHLSIAGASPSTKFYAFSVDGQ